MNPATNLLTLQISRSLQNCHRCFGCAHFDNVRLRAAVKNCNININGTPIRVYLPISNLPYWRVASKWASKNIWKYHLFCCRWYITNEQHNIHTMLSNMVYLSSSNTKSIIVLLVKQRHRLIARWQIPCTVCSSCSHPNITESNAKGLDCRADFQMAICMCTRFMFTLNAYLVSGSVLSAGAFGTFFYQPSQPDYSSYLRHFRLLLLLNVLASSIISPMCSDNRPNLCNCTPLLKTLITVLFPMSKHWTTVSKPDWESMSG